ncbi:MAG: PEP-CTERM sorting domain-containing protein, partial [Gemmatimonadales bacterium]|nr:PEP-CTERM sorting domain-containing protein [Gemmatimonadales bacterium]
GIISGTNVSSQIQKNEDSTLTLTGNSTFHSDIFINDGVLSAQSDGALGETVNGATAVADGGTLNVTGGITNAERIFLNGLGHNNTGALNSDGSNTLNGLITLQSASTIQSDSGTLTLTGGITGTDLNLTFDGAGDTTVSTTGITIGTGTLTKNGSGTTTLSGTNTYTGPTIVNAGTLLVNGDNSAATGAVTVNTGGTLGGTGTIGGDTSIASGGFLSPGDGGVGTLTFNGDLDISAAVGGPDGSLLFDVGDTVVLTSGTLTIGDGLLNVFDFVFSGITPGTYPLFLTNNVIATVVPDGLAEPTDFTAGNRRYRIFLSDDNTDIYLSIHLIPEPTTLGLAVIGLLGLVLWRPRRRRA